MGLITAPVLPSRSFDDTVAFWSWLGFVPAQRWDDYLIMANMQIGIELHFWLHPDHDPLSNQAGAYIRFSTPQEAGDLYREWKDRIPADGEFREATKTPWNMIEFSVIDGDGNLVKVGAQFEPE